VYHRVHAGTDRLTHGHSVQVESCRAQRGYRSRPIAPIEVGRPHGAWCHGSSASPQCSSGTALVQPLEAARLLVIQQFAETEDLT